MFLAEGVLHGTASVSGGKASGSYTDFMQKNLANVTYSGTVSAQKNLNLTFTDPSNMTLSLNLGGPTYNMSYDGIYNQSASLTAIAGNYLGVGFNGNADSLGVASYSPSLGGGNLTISGSTLTLGAGGSCVMNGTVSPHGTVNVFDVSLPLNCPRYQGTRGPLMGWPYASVPVGTTYKGILFRTSGSLKNYIEIVATSGNSAWFYMGSK